MKSREHPGLKQKHRNFLDFKNVSLQSFVSLPYCDEAFASLVKWPVFTRSHHTTLNCTMNGFIFQKKGFCTICFWWIKKEIELFQTDFLPRRTSIEKSDGEVEGRDKNCAFLQNSLCLVLIEDWSFSMLLYLPVPQPSHFSKYHREHRNSQEGTRFRTDSVRTKPSHSSQH